MGSSIFGDIELPSGSLDAAVFKRQCPLALEAAANPGPYAGAAVVADAVEGGIQERLIEHQQITH